MPGVTGVQHVPRRRSLAELQRYIAEYVLAADDPETLASASSAIASGVDYLNTRRWNKRMGQQELTLVEGQRDYELNADFLDPRGLYLDRTYDRKINYVPWKEWNDRWDIGTDGNHLCSYSVDYAQRLLWLDSAPALGLLAESPLAYLHYFRRFLPPVETGNVLDAPSEFGLFLGWYGRWELALSHGRAGLAQVANEHWSRVYRQLLHSDNETQTDW